MREIFSDMAHVEGRPVTDGHARYCRQHGHAMRTVGGNVQADCPRCGERRGPYVDMSDADLNRAIHDAGDVTETDWYDVGGEIQAAYLDALLEERGVRTSGRR